MIRKSFYDGIRSLTGPLSELQVGGFNRILDEAEAVHKTQPERLAYMLATVWHETAHKMQPIREMGSEAYLRSKKYYPWVGEGLVQVTWEVNHRKFGATKPGQLLEWNVALRALFDGMEKGMFTGKKLSDYIDGDRADYVGARRIINGTDKATTIAGYARTFEAALKSSKYGAVAGPVPKPLPRETPSVTGPALVAGAGLLATILTFLKDHIMDHSLISFVIGGAAVVSVAALVGVVKWRKAKKAAVAMVDKAKKAVAPKVAGAVVADRPLADPPGAGAPVVPAPVVEAPKA
jgi:putative chitinase